jgi:hypothetical protein
MFEGGIPDFGTCALCLVLCVLCVWYSASGALRLVLCVWCLLLVAVLIVEECPNMRDRSALLFIFLCLSFCYTRRVRYGSKEVSYVYYGV